jgi:hypothetical protein
VKAYRGSIVVLAVAFLVVGAAVIIRTALVGGGVGILLGALFIALGAARLYLLYGRR